MSALWLNPEQTVSEIVKQDFRTAAVFQKYGIDFCCKGKKPLSQACSESKLDTGDVIRDIESVSSSPAPHALAFAEWSTPELLDYLLSHHHEWIRIQSPLILQWGEKVVQTHGHAAPEAVTALEIFRELNDELEFHMLKEERVLFPFIREMDQSREANINLFGSVKAPITVMEAEHNSAGLLLRALENTTSDFTPPEWACNTFRVFYASLREFRDRLLEHVHIENNILFPLAIEAERRHTGA